MKGQSIFCVKDVINEESFVQSGYFQAYLFTINISKPQKFTPKSLFLKHKSLPIRFCSCQYCFTRTQEYRSGNYFSSPYILPSGKYIYSHRMIEFHGTWGPSVAKKIDTDTYIHNVEVQWAGPIKICVCFDTQSIEVCIIKDVFGVYVWGNSNIIREPQATIPDGSFTGRCFYLLVMFIW